MELKEKENKKILFNKNQEHQKLLKQPIQYKNACPWMSEYTASIISPILRMHNEAIDYFLFVTPQKGNPQHQRNCQNFKNFVKEVKKNKKIKNSIVKAPFLNNKCYLKGTQLQVFLYLEQISNEILSDINKILIEIGYQKTQYTDSSNKQFKQKYFYGEMKRKVINNQGDQVQIEKIILWINEDQSFNQYVQQIQKVLTSSTEIKYLYSILICMVRQRSFQNTIRSISVFGLCDVFLYERRKQKTRTLGENILKILQYFGMGTLQQRKITFIQQSKNKYDVSVNSDGFSFTVGQNLYSAIIFKDLFAVLKNRYRLISNFSFPVGKSILVYLLNPSFSQFSYV